MMTSWSKFGFDDDLLCPSWFVVCGDDNDDDDDDDDERMDEESSIVHCMSTLRPDN
mgnify:CR=1 FL=1